MEGETATQQKPAVPVLAAAPAPPAPVADIAPAPSPKDDAGTGTDSENPQSKDGAGTKRKASEEAGNNTQKQTKRRAARACVSCRARKVRCDVVEGAPCGNCRWDKVECIVQESRRRKKNIFPSRPHPHVGTAPGTEALRAKTLPDNTPLSWGLANLRRASDGSLVQMAGLEAGNSSLLGTLANLPPALYQRALAASTTPSADLKNFQHHLGQSQDHNVGQQHNASAGGVPNPFMFGAAATSGGLHGNNSLFNTLRNQQFLDSLERPEARAQLPGFIKPLPPRIANDDIQYLSAKGALTLPTLALQNACLRCFVEYVHPYMPLLDMHEFLSIVNDRDGGHGQVSLLLYQAVMFSACSFVDMKLLKEAGYQTRKDARRAFFYKTRHLYDLDYESDRLVLVQALLLMSYWYETPDDQKDTWHWMGVAISLAHTIGLHRNPTAASMPMRKQKHWKRIWWACFMRDRLVALGMRRPTRIKDEDFDVPMLVEEDFDVEPLADDVTVVSPDCTLLRDVAKQSQLAHMCIAMAKLCILIGRMLKTQYSVLIRDRNKVSDTTNSTMMLFPNKKLENIESVSTCDLDLIQWMNDLPPTCQYRPLGPLDIKNGNATIAVQRNILHMVYYTTVSALHRPQFLPSSPYQIPTASRQVQETSRMRVRDSAFQITRMAAELHSYRIDRYLQTTGVTVTLPAMIIHLLDMKNPNIQARERAVKGFRSCMKVMAKLREMYSAADYAIGFLDAALTKASIDMAKLNSKDMAVNAAANAGVSHQAVPQAPASIPNTADQMSTPPPDNVPYLNSTEVSLFHQNRSYMQTGTNNTTQAPAPAPTAPAAANATGTVTAETAMAPTPSADDSAVFMTPSPISSHASDHGGNDPHGLGIPLSLQGGDEFNWSEAFKASQDFDFDQLLGGAPAEGISYADAYYVNNNMDVMMMLDQTTKDGVPLAPPLDESVINWPTEEEVK